MTHRMRAGAALAVLAGLTVLVVGCTQGGAPPGSSNAAPSSAATALAPVDGSSTPLSPVPAASVSPASVPAASVPSGATASRPAGAAPGVRIVGSVPVVLGRGGPPGLVYVLPGAAIEHEGIVNAWFVRFAEAPGTQLVTHATSTDGRTWTMEAGPAYTDLGLGYGAPGPVPSDVRVRSDGTWELYGWGEPDDGSRTVATWRATAPDPDGPWTAEQILGPGDAGRWDDAAVRVGSVVSTPSGGLELYYEGWSRGSPSRLAIGLATSADGVTWTRFGPPGAGEAGGPVLEPGRCAGVDATMVTAPNVTVTPDGRLMLFTGFLGREPVVGAATSRDGTAWSCAGDGPILAGDDIPGAEGIHNVELFERSTGPTLLVEALGNRTTDVWLAELTLP